MSLTLALTYSRPGTEERYIELTLPPRGHDREILPWDGSPAYEAVLARYLAWYAAHVDPEAAEAEAARLNKEHQELTAEGFSPTWEML